MMQDTRTDKANERADSRPEEGTAQPKAPATTADIAGVDDDTMIARTEAAEERKPTEQRTAGDGPPVEYTSPEAAEAAQAAATREADNTPKADTTPLFDDRVTGELRERWTDVQSAFVDEPKTAVEQADALVADVMKRLAAGFADERKALEGQWSRGDDVSTEDLRLALQRYRSFFDRLLSV